MVWTSKAWERVKTVCGCFAQSLRKSDDCSIAIALFVNVLSAKGRTYLKASAFSDAKCIVCVVKIMQTFLLNCESETNLDKLSHASKWAPMGLNARAQDHATSKWQVSQDGHLFKCAKKSVTSCRRIDTLLKVENFSSKVRERICARCCSEIAIGLSLLRCITHSMNDLNCCCCKAHDFCTTQEGEWEGFRLLRVTRYSLGTWGP